MTPLPAHQLCTDCGVNKRALAVGLTGYGCLCVACFQKRMEDARKKKTPRRQTVKEPAKRNHTWSEMFNWTQEQKCAAGYCLGCEFCDGGQANRPLENLEDL